MDCEVLCIGTELLHGDIVNTNAAFISKSLASIGIDVHYHSVVGDNPKRMVEAFDLAFSRADVVICTGGLGPTKDDITKEILADYFNLPMEYDEASYEHLKKIYSRFNREMPKNNMRQTYFPKGSIILKNNNGTANACILNSTAKGTRKIGILLPGPPKEMMPLVTEEVVPYLAELSDSVVIGHKVAVLNVGESMAETMIMDLIDNQTNPTIAPYAGDGKVVFRVTAKAHNRQEAEDMIAPIVDELLKRFGDDAFVVDDEKLEVSVCKKLIEKNITICTAESCTGGLLASKLVSCAGISKVFKEGYITYSDETKIKILDVKRSTIDKYTAVSEETAREMALGAHLKSGADVSVAITGLAGPDGGTEEKPLGLVYICVYYKGRYELVRSVFTGTRETVRERAATKALEIIRKLLMQDKGDK